jgi:hypothetical protein
MVRDGLRVMRWATYAGMLGAVLTAAVLFTPAGRRLTSPEAVALDLDRQEWGLLLLATVPWVAAVLLYLVGRLGCCAVPRDTGGRALAQVGLGLTALGLPCCALLVYGCVVGAAGEPAGLATFGGVLGVVALLCPGEGLFLQLLQRVGRRVRSEELVRGVRFFCWFLGFLGVVAVGAGGCLFVESRTPAVPRGRGSSLYAHLVSDGAVAGARVLLTACSLGFLLFAVYAALLGLAREAVGRHLAGPDLGQERTTVRGAEEA